MAENVGREFGWDDQIENDGSDFILLADGEYDFEIVDFERGRYAGGDKIPPCNKAVVHVQFSVPEGTTTLKHNLYLHSNVEGLLCAFFTSIGQRKKGERLTMNWSKVVGSKGRCRVGIRKYDGKDYNEIKRFLEPEEKAASFQAGRF